MVLQCRLVVISLVLAAGMGLQGCSSDPRGGDAAPEPDAAQDARPEAMVGPSGPCEGSGAPGGSCDTDTQCDDGLRCNGIDLCIGEFGCVCDEDNPPVECDDYKSCTVDSCLEPSGSCANNPDDARCADDGNECTTPLCEPDRSGDPTGCVYDPVPNGISCEDGAGACFDGFCCRGCWDGMNCQPGDTPDACAGVGLMCANCDDSDPCTMDSCAEGVCTNTALACSDTGSECSYSECRSDMGGCVTINLRDDTPCAAGRGFCIEGVCCRGCTEAGVCREPGSEVSACGALGEMCADCNDLNACTTDSCAEGRCSNTETSCDDMDDCTEDGCNRISGCTHRDEPDETSCRAGDGLCRSGACCEGCWDGALCQTGDVVTACGVGGAMCESCDDGNPCTIDACTATGCENTYIGDDMPCGMGAVCYGGECCMGCRMGGACLPGTSRTACGTGGGSDCRACECASDDCGDGVNCPPSAYRVTGLSAGARHTCAISTPDVLYCFGDGAGGQVGHGLLTRVVSPTRVLGRYDDWRTVAAGGSHSCGIRESGASRTAWCWGTRGTNGRLGDGLLTGPAASSPVAVLGGVRSWIDIGVGSQHACGMTSSNQIYCWGEGGSGALGNGASRDQSTPVSVASGADETWTKLSVGPEHTCGIRTVCYPPASPSTCRDYEQAWCWGRGADGRLGYGGSSNQTRPTLVGSPTALQWSSISAGAQHTCAITTSNDLYCWGENTRGQLGMGSTGFDRFVPTLVAGGGMPWVSVSAGDAHTCGIRLDSTLWCWGEGSDGALGLGVSSSDFYVPTPRQVGTGTDWTEVSAGSSHTCGRKTDGTMFCWGDDTFGQLGNGSPTTGLDAPSRVCFFDPLA